MSLNRDAFISQYLDEIRDNIQNLDSTIITLKKDPDNEEDLNRILRTLHTIKGSSRMLKFSTVEKISHGLENVFKGIKERRYAVSDALVQLVFITSEYLRDCAGKISSEKDDTIDIDALLRVFERAASNEPYTLEEIRKTTPPASREDTQGPAPEPGETGSAGNSGPSMFRDLQTIRVKIDHIDSIIKNTNTLIINQFQMKKQNEALANLEETLREFRAGCEAGPVQDSALMYELSGKMSSMLKGIQKIRKGFNDQIDTIERETFDLQERIVGLRMFPLEMIFGSLPKMVEELSVSLGKSINFTITGSDVRLDKIILETISDPVLHLVRNAVDHGIEEPGKRERAGKNRTGNLSINCSSEGGNIIVAIKDDGRGINFEQVRSRALEMFPMMEDDIRAMSEPELTTFLFQPGFTTSSTVSDLSGRGVGLDIVKHKIESIKGKITVASEPGRWSAFTLTLPLSLATVGGYFVTSSSRKFFIPSNFVREILLIGPQEKIPMLNKEAVKVRDRLIPLYSMAHLLDLDIHREGNRDFVVLVESLGEIIGIVVDSIIEFATLIYKPLPPNLQQLRYIQGIVFDENYDIVNILHMPALIEKSKRMSDIELKRRFGREHTHSRNVLVVDDSVNSREIVKSIFESAHYQVITAQDGIEGLNKVRSSDFSLIVTDINMPRMDGFTFIENIKREEQYRSIPVIVISSFDDPDSKKRASDLGADSYIVKSDFDRNNLISVAKNLIG
ncbi:MAG TPA: response regulator [Spirochaetota bacterium]|nr:response regulator [Spirochaetota bacterium]